MLATPIQVYIIDDEPSVRAAYARLLRSAEMEPHTFCTVEEFLSDPLPSENACIISDIKMPGDNGLTLPSLLHRAGRDVPVIYITADDTAETREAAQQAGAAGFFRKPMDGQAFLDAIEWALSKPRNASLEP